MRETNLDHARPRQILFLFAFRYLSKGDLLSVFARFHKRFLTKWREGCGCVPRREMLEVPKIVAPKVKVNRC